MTEVASIYVTVAGRDIGLARLLEVLERRMREVDQVGLGLGRTTGGPLATGQRTAAASALALAQADARLLRDQGDLVASSQRLRTALAGIDQNTVQAIGARRQLLAVDTQLATGQSALARAFGEAGASAKSSIMGVLGPAALMTTAIGAAVGAAASFRDAFQFKATLDASTSAINAQLTGVRDVGQVWDGAAVFARRYKLTQEETNAAIGASIGVMRSSKASVEDIISVLARLQVLSPEQSLQEAAFALKALAGGDTQSLVTRFEVSRDAATAMKNEIQKGGDAVQVVSKFLDSAGIGMDTLAAKSRGAAGAIKDVAIAQENVRLAQARLVEGPGIAFTQVYADGLNNVADVMEGRFIPVLTAAGNTATTSFGAALAISGQDINKFGGGLFGLGNLALKTGVSMIGAGQGVRVLGEETNQAAASADRFGGSIGAEIAAAIALVQAHRTLAPTIQQVTAAASEDAVMMQQVGVQTDAATVAAQQHIIALAAQTQQSLQASIQTQELSQLQAQLASLGGQVASGLMSAADAASVLAGRYGFASGEASRLILLQAQLANAQAAQTTGLSKFSPSVQNMITGGRSAASVQESTKQADAIIGDIRRERDAQLQADLAIARSKGDTRRQIELLRQSQQGLNADSAQYKNTEAQIIALQRGGGRAGGGSAGAGATRLTDQQKFHNTLLADQDRYQDQSEAAERAHEQKLLDIDRQFYKASLAQQKANEISKRRSELDFLEQITSSELNQTKEGRAEITKINEKYYSDFAAAQATAQAGNAKQSEEMVNQARHRADVELQYAEKIEAARKAKNASEVARLTALREKERQLLAEQDKQIAEGGDPNAKARQEAIDAESDNFQEQQGKIKTASDDATQRKIDNAIREGKDVDALNLKYKEQEDTINRIAASRGGAPSATGGASATPTPAGAAAAVPAGTVDLSALASGLSAIQAAITEMNEAVTRAVEADTRQTTAAIRQTSSARVIQ